MKISPLRQMLSQVSSHSLRASVAIAVVTLLVITGCSSSDDPVTPEPTEDLSSTDDLLIRQSAAEKALASLNNNLTNTAQLADAPLPALDSPTLNPITGENVTGMNNTNQTSAGQLNTESNSLLYTSLGLDENSQAVVTQKGNLITIDPDEQDICTEELAGNEQNQQEFDICVALAADLTIEINAQTEDIGVITFFFRGIPVVAISYAPTSSRYDLYLAGVQAYEDAYIEIYNQQVGGSSEDDVANATTYAGIVRLSNTFDPNDADVGKMSVDVIETVRVSFSGTYSSYDYSLTPGTLIAVETFAGSGNGIVEMNLGAYTSKYQSDYDGVQDSSEVRLPGLTGRMELTKDGSDLKVSNLALDRGPLTVTVNSVEQFRASLENLGFTLSDSDGELVLDTNLNFSLFTLVKTYSTSTTTPVPDPGDSASTGESVVQETSEEKTQLTLSAIAGTGLLGQIASTKVTQGGPFNIDLQVTVDDVPSSSSSLSVSAGQCFGDDDVESNGPVDIVECDQQ